MKILGEIVMTFVIAVAFSIGLALFLGWLTAMIVNYLFTASLIAAIFGTVKITWVQGFVINVLSGILFKSNTSSKKD